MTEPLGTLGPEWCRTGALAWASSPATPRPPPPPHPAAALQRGVGGGGGGGGGGVGGLEELESHPAWAAALPLLPSARRA